MNKAVIFDLDDTLYPEIDYVKSGFHVIAKYLERYGLNEIQSFDSMMELLHSEGRGKIFDKLLLSHNLYSQDLVNSLVFIYRTHMPKITLTEQVPILFDILRTKGYKIGILTDGHTIMQIRKVEALGLEKIIDTVVYTDVLGTSNWKPSEIPYKVALELMRATPKQSFYIGDNPKKDFKGANEVGIKTVWLKKDKSVKYDFNTVSEKPDLIIHSLEEILNLISV